MNNFFEYCKCGHTSEEHHLDDEDYLFWEESPSYSCAIGGCGCQCFEAFEGDIGVGEDSPFPMSACEVAQAIEANVMTDWSGNCFAIATAMVEAGLVQGKATYGLWLGPVAEASMFYGKAIVRHGWVTLADGTIVDPTRWVFEGALPYIYQGDNGGNYDMGATSIKRILSPPTRTGDEAKHDYDPSILGDAVQFVAQLLGLEAGDSSYTRDELFWLLNLPYTSLEQHAESIYRAAIAAGDGVLVPIDYRLHFGLMETVNEKH